MIIMQIVPTCRAVASAELLHQYEGPTAFAIPGNHDWIDGLETYTRHIQHKGWLGGWLLPQVGLYSTTVVADWACFRCMCWGRSTAFAASACFPVQCWGSNATFANPACCHRCKLSARLQQLM